MKYKEIKARVYYENTDAGGIMYHAQYLHFAERGRTEFMRDIGHECGHLVEEFGVMFVARTLDIEYFSPAFLDDLIEVRTSICAIKNSSFVMKQTFFRHNDGVDQRIAELNIVLVGINSKTLRPVRLPDILRNDFKQYLVSDSADCN